MTKISIIMPVYNGENWLEESINSVLGQTFSDFELICVNDSSTDESERVLEKFSNQDSRVKFYTKENEGPGMALNYGVERAEGEYLCFLDQDDKYAPNYLEAMFDTIQKTGCNLCLCNAYYWYEDKIERVPYHEVEYFNNLVTIDCLDKKLFFNYFCPLRKIITEK